MKEEKAYHNPPADKYQTIVRGADGKLRDVTLPMKGYRLVRDERGQQRLARVKSI